ncbi:RNA polymerase sigma factor [Parvibacter caecicola]|uniref:RNA polymerase sigma factor n=1 Tax=Parvibacter caecicola TaxID=747645 RepID=UPI0023F1AB35|nr:sigma-70 family RNA polymerase sigma factor [Parvibacter caecicola]
MAEGSGHGNGSRYDEHAKEKLAELVVRAQADDRAAFEELYRRTAQAQYFTIVGRVGEEPAADILQEVYLVAWKNRAKIRPQAVLGYLSATARNLCLQHFQERSRMADAPVTDAAGAEAVAAGDAADGSLGTDAPVQVAGAAVEGAPGRGAARGQLVAQGGVAEAADSAAQFSAAERRERLARALREDLSDRERDMVLMRYYLDMKVGQIAEQLDVSRNTVRNVLNQALATLRRKVGVLPMGAGLSAALAEAVEAPLAPGVRPWVRPRSQALSWGTRAVAAITVAAAVGVLGVAAAWRVPEPVADEPVPLTEPEPAPAPSDTTAPELLAADVENGLLVLTTLDDAGMESAWCIGEDGTRYDPVNVEYAGALPTDVVQPSGAAQGTQILWWFEVPSGAYEVHLVDTAGNEASGTVNADVKPIYPAPVGAR